MAIRHWRIGLVPLKTSYSWTVAGPRSNREPKRPWTEFAPDPEPKKRNDDSQLVNVVSLIEIISI